MSKTFQIILAVFITLSAAVLLYFVNDGVQQIAKQAEEIENLKEQVAEYAPTIRLMRDTAQLIGKEGLPPDVQKVRNLGIKVTPIESVYCSDNDGGIVLRFDNSARMDLWEFDDEEPREMEAGTPPTQQSPYLIAVPYIYFVITENGKTKKLRFTIGAVDSRGYITQFYKSDTIFSNGNCPKSILNAF